MLNLQFERSLSIGERVFNLALCQFPSGGNVHDVLMADVTLTCPVQSLE